MSSQPFLSEPMLPGLPGGYPTYHHHLHHSATILPQTQDSQPKNTLHPPHSSSERPITTNPNHNPTNTKPLNFPHWNRKVIQNVVDNNLIVSIYVENLPNRWTPIDAHLVMSRFGDVMDIFIPQKLKKKGNHFAFIYYKRSGDVRELTTKINTLQLDGLYLSASLAKNRETQTGVKATPITHLGAQKQAGTNI
ncbi:hypothetical protein Tsubulata_006379 [Turnera subulata]|uniref:RRM domain-containing protein n=1 Tax=Turnera subulata TaxID=218843 RepID=A0A9Q0EZA2_9ROSI|nr:hypothetical protein Tsubulata_006379 [Turnera subulata]